MKALRHDVVVSAYLTSFESKLSNRAFKSRWQGRVALFVFRMMLGLENRIESYHMKLTRASRIFNKLQELC